MTEGFDRAAVLRLVAAAEGGLEHPVARAIIAAAEAHGLELPEASRFDAHAGYGISAEVDGHLVQVGADRFMTSLGITLEGFAQAARDLAKEAASPLYAAIDGKLAALLAVTDPVKLSTPAAIAGLQALGLKVAMITGDNRETARAIAARLGIDHVVAEVLPDGKVDAVQRLRQGNRKVAFVGDGINDAPALAQADVGFAIGTGTDVAIESAAVTLMSGSLHGVADAMAISRATLGNIKQNLFGAFIYNSLGVPVAAGALYPLTGSLLSPVIAGAAMSLSSVTVVSNANRLRLFNPQRGKS